MTVRPMIKNVLLHKHFVKDLGNDKKRINVIVKDILDCANLEFHELHKFEKKVDENLVFRAKKEKIHFVYCVSKMRVYTILFLRAMKNFSQYKRLLSDKKKIRKLVSEAK
jgi:hypothetical protein